MATKAKPKRALLFDFDGVVADSWDLHEQCWREVLAEHGAELDREPYAQAIGLSSLETAELLVKHRRLSVDPAALAEQKRRLIRQRSATELKPMVGVVEAMARLRPEFTVGVTSVRRGEWVTEALARFAIADKTDLVVLADDQPAGQEPTELYAIAVKQLDLPAERVAVVEDARTGVLAAKRAGIGAIAFNSHPNYELDFSMADAVITSLDELVPELINQVIVS